MQACCRRIFELGPFPKYEEAAIFVKNEWISNVFEDYESAEHEVIWYQSGQKTFDLNI